MKMAKKMGKLASDRVVQAFNQQVGNELGASNQYVQIAAYFADASLTELAKFFYKQSSEEREHAMKFVRFLVDVEGKVAIPQVEAPKTGFKSAADAVQASLEWEMTVTQQIYDLVEIVQAEANYIALRFLDWFVTEQLEEVSSMKTLLDLVNRAGEANLLYVEDYLARRGGVVTANPIGEGDE
jgi:bacterioferritin B